MTRPAASYKSTSTPSGSGGPPRGPQPRDIIAHTRTLAAPGADGRQDEAGREGNLQVFSPALTKTVGALRDLGKRVWIVGPTPGAPKDIPFQLAMADRTHRKDPAAISLFDFSRSAAGFDVALSAALAVGGVFYTDPRSWFCNRSGRCDYMRSGELLYRDNGHLSVQGAHFVSPRLGQELFRFVNDPHASDAQNVKTDF